MTNKTMGSKLADSLRQVRGEKPGAPIQPRTVPTPQPAAAHTEPPRNTRGTGSATFAKQSDQSPPASLDRPWENLHPARIWPD